MLEVIANALRSPSSRLIENCCGSYMNKKGVWGYYLTIWDAGHYHMISVSDVSDEIPTNESVANAITSPLRCVAEDGRYRNSKGHLGYWATLKTGDHWYMVSVSDMLEPFHREWWIDRFAV